VAGEIGAQSLTNRNGSQRTFSDADLESRVAIVTGGGRGIGEAVALAFASHGARVVITSRTESELEEVACKIERIGATVMISQGDVSDPADVDRTVRLTVQRYGTVDLLVNAAAIHGPLGPSWEAEPEAWITALRVNLGGTFLYSRAVLPHMIAKRRGKIINFSGGGATSASPYMSAYGVSKAAVVRLTETIAEEVRSFNIQVNAIAPGMVDTRIHDDVLGASMIVPETKEAVRKLKNGGIGGTPIELPAALALFLASSKADRLSGKLISAPHDDWRSWNEQRIADLMGGSWLALRRIDHFTLKQLTPQTTSR